MLIYENEFPVTILLSLYYYSIEIGSISLVLVVSYQRLKKKKNERKEKTAFEANFWTFFSFLKLCFSSIENVFYRVEIDKHFSLTLIIQWFFFPMHQSQFEIVNFDAIKRQTLTKNKRTEKFKEKRNVCDSQLVCGTYSFVIMILY